MKKYPYILLRIAIALYSPCAIAQEAVQTADKVPAYTMTRAPVLYYDPQQPYDIDRYRDSLRAFFPPGYEIRGVPLSADPAQRERQLLQNRSLLLLYRPKER